MTKSKILAAIGLLSLSGCGDPNEVSQAKDAVSRNAKDPDSVKFRDITYNRKEEMVCGEYNAKNSYGAYAGFETFVYSGFIVREWGYPGFIQQYRTCLGLPAGEDIDLDAEADRIENLE